MGEVGVTVERVLEQVRERREHQHAVYVEVVEQLEPRRRLAERRDAVDRLPRHLPQALSLRVGTPVEVDVGARRGDLLEGRVGHVVGDLALHCDAGTPAHLHELDVARVPLREVLREHLGRLVEVVVGVEDGEPGVWHVAPFGDLVCP